MFSWFRKKTKPLSAQAVALSKPKRPSRAVKAEFAELIEQLHQSQLGPFEDLNLDLGKFIEAHYEAGAPVHKMAYAYARRTSAAGLYFQGITQKSAFTYVQDMFRSYQQVTGQTISFQREAGRQAHEAARLYVPRMTRPQERALLHYASAGIRATELAMDVGYEDIDDLEDDPVSIDTCLDLIDFVLESDSEAYEQFHAEDQPNPIPRLIDYVEKVSDSQYGPFANMSDDLKASAEAFLNRPPLFDAAGYALLLARCGLYIGGGMHPKLIIDTLEITAVLMSDMRRNPDLAQVCKQQACDLARTYGLKMTPEAAAVIIEMGQNLERLNKEGEPRLTAADVVLRTTSLARDRFAAGSSRCVTEGIQPALSVRIKPPDMGADILSIVKNDTVLYLNQDVSHLYRSDKDGDEKLDGRVVNVVFLDQSSSDQIEIFVIFDEADSYAMFTAGVGRDERLSQVCEVLFRFFAENHPEIVFRATGNYATQFHYTFKSYKKGQRFYLINGGRTQAYLIEPKRIRRDDVDGIIEEFWN